MSRALIEAAALAVLIVASTAVGAPLAPAHVMTASERALVDQAQYAASETLVAYERYKDDRIQGSRVHNWRAAFPYSSWPSADQSLSRLASNAAAD
jgi:hypothetical protein